MYKVIDVSDWQGKIDWKKVKADGVVGAIIRYADGTTLDKRFAENMKNAKAAGIHIGSYIFSRASTKAQAENEANRLYNACKPYAPDMPLYIDLEASGLSKYADTVASAFLNKMKALGGKGGVYANLNWWNNYLKKTAKNYSASPFWIAQYNSTMDYKPSSVMGMWQYSSKGKVSGIKGNVDMDKCYVEYWKKISTPAPTPTPAPTKKTIDELAQEVLDGKWGAGNTRKKRLIEAGYDYDAVQNRVNEIIKSQKKTYDGEFPSTKLVKTTQQVIDDALIFSRWIVNDNRFGYGRQGGANYKGTKVYSITHSGGCHFCGSNAHKIKDAKNAGLPHPEQWEYTYVCNTFVHACYAHAGVPSMLSATGHAWWTSDYRKSKYWTEFKKPAKITDCKPGDVFGWDGGHYCLYIGNSKGREATSGGLGPTFTQAQWNKTIRETSFTNHFKKATYFFRFTGTVNTTSCIRYGEVSDRVRLLQKYLKWYGIDISDDKCFGDGTLDAVKKFQKATGLTVDGIVGDATIAAMRAYKK